MVFYCINKLMSSNCMYLFKFVVHTRAFALMATQEFIVKPIGMSAGQTHVKTVDYATMALHSITAAVWMDSQVFLAN